MSLKLLTKALILLLIVIVAASAVLSWQTPTHEYLTKSASEKKSEAEEKSVDDATLNLHRWGAVTLFHGLPSDRVNAITEDANGALWFGTDNGLVRYDGRRTQVVGNDADSRGVLPAQRIRALLRDSAGGLWIGTDQGAARFVQDKLKILPETNGLSVTGFAESNANEIGVVTAQGKIIVYRNERTDMQVGKSAYQEKLIAQIVDDKTYPLLNIENQAVALTAIAFGAQVKNQGAWLLGSGRRGALVYRNNELIEAKQAPPRPYFVEAVYSSAGAGNKIWLGAQAGNNSSGLWWLDAANAGGLQQFTLPTGKVTAIHGGQTSEEKNELWVATEGNGAFLLRDEQPIEHVTFENTKGGLRSNKIYSVYRDREGVVWFGTERGVCRYDRDSFRATNLSTDPNSNFIRSLVTTKEGVTYAGTNRGLFKLAAGLELGGWQPVTEIGNRAVYALLETANKEILAATSSGLFMARPGENNFVAHAPENNTNAYSFRALTEFQGKIFALVFEQGIARVDADAVRFVATDPLLQKANCWSVSPREKIIRIGTNEKEYVIFDGTNVRKELITYKEGMNEPSGAIRALAHTTNKKWVGKGSGLSVYVQDQWRTVIPNIDVQALTVINVSADQQPIIYCATKNAGLYKILAESEAIAHIDTEQGLPSQQVFAVSQGTRGEIWIGTNRGIVRHLPNPQPPILEPRRLVADVIYSADYLIDELRFPGYQKTYLLEIAGLGSKTFPSQFQYEYALTEEKRGALKQYVTSESQIELKDMTPGNYTITARAISRDLVYSAPYKLRLWISPEPTSWTTILLTALLVIALGAGGYAFYQQRRTAKANQALAVTNEELRETRIRLANNTEAERARIARDLHDQTLADLRHLLVMTDQMENLGQNTVPHFTPPAPHEIRRKIEEVSNEIRHICEDLSPSVLENIGFIPALEWALSNAVRVMPAAEKFTYEFICEPDLEDKIALTPTEQIQLYRIVQEAINNVVKHAKATNVILKVALENENDLVITVEDDGVGLPLDNEQRLGQGMGNIRSRANLINAEVVWEDRKAGCTFRARLTNVVAPRDV